MSDVRTPDEVDDEVDIADHDPWWGDVGTYREPDKRTTARSKPARPTSARRPGRVANTTYGSRVVTELTRSVRASSRIRRALVIAAVAAMIVVVLTCSVGVIMLNNLVIRRSAALGSLDSSRKKLRTSNAMLSAANARLSAPPRVSALALKRLGMVRSSEMPQYIFLDPDNSPALPVRRGRRQRRLAAARAAALARQQAAAAVVNRRARAAAAKARAEQAAAGTPAATSPATTSTGIQP